MSFLAPIIGAVAGSLLNRSAKGGTTSESAKREPWEPVQPWLRDQIDYGQQLEDYYRQNPFNDQQKASYENLFSDIDQFRGGIAPGLFGMVSNIIGSPYQVGQRPSLPPSGGWFGSGSSNGSGTAGSSGGSAGGGESFVQGLARMGTPDNKAEVYNQMRASGLSDAEIRTRVGMDVGQQSDTDWDYLQQLARQALSPAGGRSSPPANLFAMSPSGTRTPPINWEAANPNATIAAARPPVASAPSSFDPYRPQAATGPMTWEDWKRLQEVNNTVQPSG